MRLATITLAILLTIGSGCETLMPEDHRAFVGELHAEAETLPADDPRMVEILEDIRVVVQEGNAEFRAELASGAITLGKTASGYLGFGPIGDAVAGLLALAGVGGSGTVTGSVLAGAKERRAKRQADRFEEPDTTT